MNKENFQIHPQLSSDSHELFEWQHCHIRLHKNATLPWLIIIPKTELVEFHDLSIDLQSKVTHISQIASTYFKTECGAEKINFAAIGNVVQQLHIHVIGRHTKDPLWPDVVWGNPMPEKAYPKKELDTIKLALMNQLHTPS